MQQSRTGGPVWGYVCAVLVRWRWGVSEWLYRRLFSVALFSGMPNMAPAVIRARAAKNRALLNLERSRWFSLKRKRLSVVA